MGFSHRRRPPDRSSTTTLPPTIVAMTVMARISSGVASVTSPLTDRDIAQRARCQVAAARLVAEGVRGVHGHGAQALFGGQQLVEDPRGASPGSRDRGRPSRRRSDPPAARRHRSGRSPGRSMARPSPPRRAGRRRRSRATVLSHADLFAGVGFGTEVAEIVPLQHPVGRRPVEVDDRGQVHGDHASKLVIGHLDGVIDAVVERVRTRWAQAPPRMRRAPSPEPRC